MSAAQGILAEVELLQEITEATRAAVQAFVVDRCDKDGIITNKALTNFARLAGFGKQPYLEALEVCPMPCSPCPKQCSYTLRPVPSAMLCNFF